MSVVHQKKYMVKNSILVNYKNMQNVTFLDWKKNCFSLSGYGVTVVVHSVIIFFLHTCISYLGKARKVLFSIL